MCDSLFIEPVCADNGTATGGAEKISISTGRTAGQSICALQCALQRLKCSACFTTPTRCCSPASSSDSRSAFTSSFPSFSIGLASFLAVLEALWLKTGKALYLDLFKYWLKIFAVVFAMGVVSGIVMSYQFGTNWAVFSDKAGPIIGPLMAYEVLDRLLPRSRLPRRHAVRHAEGRASACTSSPRCMVAIGTFISAFWILSVNSWMQTPTGYAINADGQFVPAAGWLADHLQSELSLSPRAHRHRAPI